MHPTSGSHLHDYDYYFPVFASLEFVFYVGWLKVAETLINPFGEDDDDFDTNFLVDRNIQLCFLLIDQVGRFPPEPEKDKFWDSSVPSELPYTVASLPFRTETPSITVQKRVNDAPIYMARKQSRIESDELIRYPSLYSVVSGIRSSLFRQNSHSETDSIVSFDVADKTRKISVRSVDGPHITRHGAIQEGNGLNFPKLTIPGTIQELKETDSPLVRSKDRHTLRGGVPTPPAIQRIIGGHRKVKTYPIL